MLRSASSQTCPAEESGATERPAAEKALSAGTIDHRAKPSEAEHVRRGHELFAAQRFDEALAAYDLAPSLAESWLGRARTLKHLQRRDEAVAAYREALARGGDAEVISFSLAALDAAPAPPVAPTRLIVGAYDQHADHYDRHMVDVLKYRIPEHVMGALGPLPARALDVLDLGCGTGLMGARVRPFARTLIGVDLSSQMLRIARERQIFDKLACMELLAFVRTQRACFDLVLAADVLVYFGDLSDVFAAVGNALRAGGRFGFSVESDPDRDFVLKPSLRFAHSEAHLRRRAQDHGFRVQALASKPLRSEAGSNVMGHVAVLRRD
jgi:predicted TPR repeat methyltransferase